MIKTKCAYCGKEIEINKYQDKAYNKHFCCQKCYGLSRRLVHEYVDNGECIEFYIGDYKVIFDREDLDKVKKYRWTLFPQTNNIYCRATSGELMHRVIMNCLKSDLEIDHVSHNTLDNRKANLKICTNNINAKNKLLTKSYTQTKYTYVVLDNGWKTPKYKVRITEGGKRYYLGQYSSIEKAIEVRNKFLKSHNRFFESVHDRSDNNKSLVRK
jgi:hypothetical protein